MSIVVLAGSLALLAVGIWLSAFFSGSETAFYRVSLLRVAAAAQTGDRACRRILRFVRQPAAFVATVLVGNNVANYIVTLAIGGVLAVLAPRRSDAIEIAATVALAPFVFLLGELVPKNVNFLQPLRSLASRIRIFGVFHSLLLPLSWPLVQLTRLIQRGNAADVPAGLGRNQLSDLIEKGEQEGVLTRTQVRLGNALLKCGAEPIGEQVGAIDMVSVVPLEIGRDEAIETAHRYGLTWLVLRTTGPQPRWGGSVSIGQLLASDEPPHELARRMPHLRHDTPRLLAAQLIRESGGGYAVVLKDRAEIGLVSLQAVARPLLSADRPPATASLGVVDR